MPLKSRRACSYPLCPALVESGKGGRCLKHATKREGDVQRYSTTRWYRFRSYFLNNNPLCSYCLKEGKLTASHEVHHKIAVKTEDDPLMFEPSNCTALCKVHHSRITMKFVRNQTYSY